MHPLGVKYPLSPLTLYGSRRSNVRLPVRKALEKLVYPLEPDETQDTEGSHSKLLTQRAAAHQSSFGEMGLARSAFAGAGAQKRKAQKSSIELEWRVVGK
jgi:hypothetical protein